MTALKITKENFKKEILESDKPVLLDFWAAWCGPCRMVSPVVDMVAEENPDIKVGKVNVDEQQELASAFGVMSIPTLVAVSGGKEVNRIVGAVPKESILKMLGK
jgi:thioredoxin 1